ncbi:putative mitochondrial protein AtMg00310 [Castanea sativa]|uniref:putative mitochondrial protein AtMg00310 n=1 Tax=Castanea sativa TaxID=21020 RepID=UPI003F64EF1A
MSSFNIPSKTCDNLDSLTRRFWWKPKASGGRYIAWKAREKLCHPKCIGGLGFKKAKEFNSALLAKVAWMIATKRDNIYMNVLKAKYKVSQDWLYNEPPRIASPCWRAIENAKKLILKGVCYLIGDETSINVWMDLWVPWIQGFKPEPRDQSFSQVPIMKESLMWALDSKGIFLVKYAYRVLIEQDKSSNPAGVPWKKLWKARLPERVKMLIWRLGSNAFPTKDNLMKRLANVDPTCIFCKEKLESGVHLFCECPVTKAI